MKPGTFGDRLRQILSERDMSQRELSAKLYVSESTVSGYVNNDRQPEYEILKNISGILHVSCDYLIGNSFIKDLDGEYLDDREFLVMEGFRKLKLTEQEIIGAMINSILGKH